MTLHASLCQPHNHRPYPCFHLSKGFSEAESTVRAHKTSGSADFELDELCLLGAQESFSQLEEIIASTDHLTQPFIQAMTSWYVAAHSRQLVMSLTELPELAQCSFSLFDGRKDVCRDWELRSLE